MGSLGVLQLRRVLRALGMPTEGNQAQLADRLRGALASGRLSNFAKEKKRAAASPDSSQCGECLIYGREKGKPMKIMYSMPGSSFA